MQTIRVFYFEVHHGEEFTADEQGLNFNRIEGTGDEATRTLAEMAKDVFLVRSADGWRSMRRRVRETVWTFTAHRALMVAPTDCPDAANKNLTDTCNKDRGCVLARGGRSPGPRGPGLLFRLAPALVWA